MDETPQSKGGRARAKALPTHKRREIAIRAANARWAKLIDPNSIPRASHQGLMPIGDVEVEVYRLEDGRRLIAKGAMAKALTLKSEGGNAFVRNRHQKRGTIRDQRKAMAKNSKSDSFQILGDRFGN